MERAEIAELFYNALIGCNDAEQLFRFISSEVEWILSAADPQTLGEESPQKAIKFSGRQGFRTISALLSRQVARDFWRAHRVY
jgi:hypothetical protein